MAKRARASAGVGVPRRGAAAGCVFALLVGHGARASAQTARGWALDRYEPPPPGDAFFFAEHPWYRGARGVAAAVTLAYAADPLWLRLPRDGLPPVDRAVVASTAAAHLGVAFAPFDRLAVHLALPVTLAQSGEALPAGVGNLAPSAGAAAGDLRVGLRLRVAGDAGRDPISLHLGALLWIPTGSPDDNTGDGAARAEGRVVLAGRVARLRWSAGAGVHLRGAVSALNLGLGNELRATAAVGVALLDDRLGVGPEASVFTSIGELPRGRGNAAFARSEWGAEVLLGARWRVADPVQVGLAGGFGLGDGYGVPEARALLTLAYAPGPRAAAPPRRVAPPVAPPAARVDAVAPLPMVVTAPVVTVDPVAVVAVAAAPPPVEAGALATREGSVVRTAAPVDFDAHHRAITGARSFAVLDAVAALLRATPTLELDVQVHSGHRSNPGFHRALSARRAERVRAYLVARGVAPDRLRAHGLGSACLDPSGAARGDAARVQFVVVAAGEPGGECVRGR